MSLYIISYNCFTGFFDVFVSEFLSSKYQRAIIQESLRSCALFSKHRSYISIARLSPRCDRGNPLIGQYLGVPSSRDKPGTGWFRGLLLAYPQFIPGLLRVLQRGSLQRDIYCGRVHSDGIHPTKLCGGMRGRGIALNQFELDSSGPQHWEAALVIASTACCISFILA